MTRHSLRTAGFTLLEVLVALVVLSIGLLGIAAMVLDSLRASRAALRRTQAVALAADMADRIRANRIPANAYDCGGPCQPDAGGNAVAAADLGWWCHAVGSGLPEGIGAIHYEAGGAGVPAAYTVRVNWTDGGDAVESTYRLRVEL